MSDTTKGLREIRDRMDNFRANVASAWVSEELAEMVDEMDRALLEAEEESGAKKLHRNESTEENRRIWENVDKVAARSPLKDSEPRDAIGEIISALCTRAETSDSIEDAEWLRGLAEKLEKCAAPEPEPEEGEPDKMTDHLMRVAELATHEERIEALEKRERRLNNVEQDLARLTTAVQRLESRTLEPDSEPEPVGGDPSWDPWGIAQRYASDVEPERDEGGEDEYEALRKYALAYGAYNRSEGGVEETRRLERLEDELAARLRSRPSEEAGAIRALQTIAAYKGPSPQKVARDALESLHTTEEEG